MFVSSGDLLTRLKEKGATNFISGVLHVASFQEDQGANSIKAVPGDPVGGGIALDLDYGAFPSGFVIELLGLDWTTVADHLSVASDAAPVFLQERDRVVGSRFPKTGQDAKGRVVFNAFALEAVPGDGPAPNNRTTLIADAVRFLAPDLAGGSTIAFDAPAYTLPSSVVVEATDSARAGTGEVKAKLTSTSLPGSIDIALAETARRVGGREVDLVRAKDPDHLVDGPARDRREIVEVRLEDGGVLELAGILPSLVGAVAIGEFRRVLGVELARRPDCV